METVQEKTMYLENESMADLFRDLRDESINMLREQIELAKTETGEKVSEVGRNTGYLFGGLFVAFAGILFILTGLTFLGYYGLMAAGMSSSTASILMPLITGAVVSIIGVVLSLKAIRTFKRVSVVPEKTIQSIKEDKQWLSRRPK